MRRKLFLSRIVLSILLSLFLVGLVEADSSMWTRTYGGADYDEAHSLVETSDWGYAIAGGTTSFGAGNNDFWLVKTDEFGNAEWNKTYGGPQNERAYSVVNTSDGGYALAGYTYSFGAGDRDFWLVKTDASGTVEWNQTYGGADDDFAYVLVATSDGGYALAGDTRSFGAGIRDAWLVKTDEFGNEEWNQTYGGTEVDTVQSLVATGDGGYALAGYTMSFGAGNRDFWLVKTNSSGYMEWSMTYGGTDNDWAFSLVEVSDGGYAIAGDTTSYGAGAEDFWLVKTDEFGNAEWNKTYGGTDNERASSLIKTSDGGYAVAGATAFNASGYGEFWLVKTDAFGNIEWNWTYGGFYHDEWAYSVVEASNGGYTLAGYTESFGAGNKDFWLVKTDEYGIVPEYSSWLVPSLLLAATLVIVIHKKKLFNLRSNI